MAAGADRTFELTGATRLGKEQGWPPKVITEEFETNERRLDLVASLLREKRFDDARGALGQVIKDAEPGRATTLQGRLAALQSDCAKAKELFEGTSSMLAALHRRARPRHRGKGPEALDHLSSTVLVTSNREPCGYDAPAAPFPTGERESCRGVLAPHRRSYRSGFS